MPIGKKVQVTQFAETPLEGVNQILKIVDQPMPDVKTLGDTDVLIEVKSSSVGWVDLLMTSGQYQHQPPLPYTPGLEYCGVVLWIGAAVDNDTIKIGDKVMVDGFISGPRSPGKHQQYGGFATYAVAKIEAIIPMTKRLSCDQA